MSTKTTAQEPSIIRLQQGITRKVAASKGAGFKEIPTIDVSRMYSESLDDRIDLAKEVREACTGVGFMQIKNHGVDWDIVDTAFSTMKKFFELPVKAKMQVHQHKNAHFHGYEPLYETNVNMLKRGDCKEAFSFGYSPENDPEAIPDIPEILVRTSIWPTESVLPGFKSRVLRYQQALIVFARRFIRIFALALDLPENYFDKKITAPMGTVRALHYPPMTAPDDEETGLGAHTDIEFFTIIAQTMSDYPALEVLNADGEWVKVYPTEKCFVVNLADMFMRMTNDTFVSTVHRVINKGNVDRYSLPFFFGINPNELVEVLDTCVSGVNPRKYDPMTTLEHSNRRLRVSRHKHPNASSMLETCPKELIVRDGMPVYV